MKNYIVLLLIVFSLLTVSCDNKPSLQKYFVEKENDTNFKMVDLSPSLLKLDSVTLSKSEKEALDSFKKMNILIFKSEKNNQNKMVIEQKRVAEILKDTTKFKPLMRFGSNKKGISVSYVGTDDNIKEFIVFGKDETAGFGVVRIIGDKMKPEDAMSLVQLMQKSNTDWSKIAGMFAPQNK
jgi:hypothetical protein